LTCDLSVEELPVNQQTQASGKADRPKLIRCLESEKSVREELKRKWPAFSAADKRHCVTLAKTGGELSNTELLTCLEMSRDVRALRSAAAASGGLSKPASSLSMPMADPGPAETASQPLPTKEAPKSEGDTARQEIERPKAEAQSSTASETNTQRKLADAEAALGVAKDEAQRARAEAEQAKAETQAARDSEAGAKRKFADAEAARAAAEKACRPGVGSRLRQWLRRPNSKDH
jgi:hypothetical protein